MSFKYMPLYLNEIVFMFSRIQAFVPTLSGLLPAKAGVQVKAISYEHVNTRTHEHMNTRILVYNI